MSPSGEGARGSSTSEGAAALAAVLLLPLLILPGGRLAGSLALTTAAFALAAAGVMARDASRFPAPRWAATTVLLAGLLAAMAISLVAKPGLEARPERLGAFRPLVVAAAAVCASYAWRTAPAWFRFLRDSALLAVGAGIVAVVVLAAPSPGVDVWLLRTEGARALAAGDDPYSVVYPNIYGPGTPYLAKALLTPDGFWITAYPYMPLTLLLDVPGMLAGDVRWVQVVALVASAAAVLRLGRGTLASQLGAGLLLVNPVTVFVLEVGWTEPVVLALLLATALAVRWCLEAPPGPGHGIRWLAAAAGGAATLAAKQYTVILLVPLAVALPRRQRWMAVATAVVLATLPGLPFLAWDPRGLVHGVLEFQLLQPFRADAISWLAGVFALGGPVLPTWPAFATAAVVLALGSRRAMPVSRALGVGAVAWMAFVMLNKQAFVNYYWLAAGMLLGAVAATERGACQPNPSPHGRAPGGESP